jgi:hypothetical protein
MSKETNNSKTRVFTLDGYWCILSRDIGESLERFIDRGEYIAKHKPASNKELERLINLSRIWANVTYDKCGYGRDIMRTIKN